MESKIEKVEAQLDDITECSICAETFKEPKILSCIHTFCKNCLLELATKLEKSPGDEIPCPICRKGFLVPDEGFDVLQRNFFMERLIEMKKFFQPSSTHNVCEACIDETGAEEEEAEEQEQEGKLPFAEVYCSDCQQKLCKECHKYHLKSKAFRKHRIIQLNEEEEISAIMPGFCEIHPSQQINVYCSDCTDAICTHCFFENHKKHTGSSIESVVGDFQKQIQKNVDTLLEFVPFLEERKHKLEKDKGEFIATLDELETEIARSREELRTSIEVHFESLLLEASNRRKMALKNMEISMDDIDTLLMSLESFKVYCNQVISKGSANSICVSVGSLNDRANELKTQYDNQRQQDFTCPRLQFTKRIHVEGRNLIGEIEAEIDTERGSDLFVDAECTVDTVYEESHDKKVSIADNIANVKATERELIDKVKDLDDVNAEKNTKSPSGTLSYNAGVISTSRFCSISESSSQFFAVGVAIIGNELFLCVRTDQTIVEIYDLETYTFKRRWTMKSHSDIRDFEGCKINNCLYVMIDRRKESEEKKEFLKAQLRRHREVGINVDTTEYIVTGDGMIYINKICRYSSAGKLIKVWQVKDQVGQLSVTDEGNILFTSWNKSELQEYKPGGQLIRIIQLHWNNGFQSLKHAIKLNSKHYLVSHGDGSEPLRRICMIDCNGNIINYYGKTGAKDQNERLQCPVYMVKDSRGIILVVDRGNRCVMVLGPDLKPIKERLSFNNLQKGTFLYIHQMQNRLDIFAGNIIIDEEHGRIFGIEEMEDCTGPYVTVFTLGSE